MGPGRSCISGVGWRSWLVAAAAVALACVAVAGCGGGGGGDRGQTGPASTARAKHGGDSGSGAGAARGRPGGPDGARDAPRGAATRATPDATREAPRNAAPPGTLDGQVGSLLVISFSGTSAPPYVLDALRGGRAGGVVLFGDNVSSRAQLRRLTGELQSAARGRAIICADQEGGSVRTLPWAPPASGQPDQTTAELAGEQAAAAARALRGAGVNMTLGPVADVARGPESAIGSRAYAGGPEEVARAVAAAVSAYLRAGIEPVPKHFPGLGAATANTDRGPVTVDASRARIEADLRPFRSAIAAGAGVVMVSHALYPALDGSSIASQSRPIVARLLRGALRFGGVAMTDSLEARAVIERSGVATAAARSLLAGEDLLLLTGPGSFPIVRHALIDRARRSPRLRARIRDAATRVAALRARLASPKG